MRDGEARRRQIPVDAISKACAYIASASGSESHAERIRLGEHLRLMGDYSVEIPLWDDSGPLTTDPAYLTDDLGLDGDLVVDLIAWGYLFDMRVGDRAYTLIGQAIADALRAALPRCRIEYHP